ncbi:MAG: alpha/beta fold hydrolase [Pseudomonadota bacterium]
MKFLKYISIFLVVILVLAAVVSFSVTRDGKLVTPEGSGTVTLDSGTYEAFPLPDYAAAVVDEDYKSYFIEVEPGIKIHVLETGSGYPVYLQHGNPTSGLLYRKVAEELSSENLRLIMPTMVGLGFSSKIPASEHTIENHIRWMSAALAALDLGGVVYVGQDWGGAIGMGALGELPDLLQGAVIMNTGFTAPTEPLDISRAHAVVKTPIVGELLLEQFITIFDRLHETQGDPASFPQDVADLYARPVLESGNAKGPLALMRMVPDGPDHRTTPGMRIVENYARGVDIPAELVWGMNDPILAQALPVMQQMFPDAPVLETEAGHFLQEEVPAEIAGAIARVVAKVQAPDVAAEAAETIVAPAPAQSRD